ncbi:MAG: protein kinase [Candidatus Woesearchaeota archaeon]
MTPLQELPLSKNRHSYTLQEVVGTGASAEVYRALDDEGKEVAVKKYHTPSKKNPQITFFNMKLEANLLKVGAHPNVVGYVDQGNKDCPYLVMEYVPTTLSRLFSKGEITQTVIKDYIIQIPSLLAHLRDREMAHCDLKCNNFGYDPETGRIKILDFGLAIPFNRSTIRPDRISDCPIYPPEFKIGIITPVSDTYSAGKTLEFLLTGQVQRRIQETIDTIGLFHDLNHLPKAIRLFLCGMINPNHIARKNPEELATYARKAVKILEEREVFKTLKFAPVSLGGRMKAEPQMQLLLDHYSPPKITAD